MSANASCMFSKKIFGDNTISLCSVLNLLAIILAYSDSLNSDSSKDILNVFIFLSVQTSQP